MARDPQSLVPLSIVAAGALIGAGLYFGLRERPIVVTAPATPSVVLAPPSAPRTPPVVVPSIAPLPPVVEPPLGPGPVAPEVVTKATEDATRALSSSKKRLVDTCWTPALRETPEPRTARFIFNLSFGPDGKETARGVSELRGESRSDVGQCLRALPADLQIPPPGAPVAVSISLEFP